MLYRRRNIVLLAIFPEQCNFEQPKQSPAEGFLTSRSVVLDVETLDRVQIARFQIAWMLAVVGVLTLFDSVTLPLLFSASLGGLIVLVEMGTPEYSRPSWVVGLRRFTLGAFVLFGLYVVSQLAQMAGVI